MVLKGCNDVKFIDSLFLSIQFYQSKSIPILITISPNLY